MVIGVRFIQGSYLVHTMTIGHEHQYGTKKKEVDFLGLYHRSMSNIFLFEEERTCNCVEAVSLFLGCPMSIRYLDR